MRVWPGRLGRHRTAHRITVWLTVLSMLLAPTVVMLTHGPAQAGLATHDHATHDHAVHGFNASEHIQAPPGPSSAGGPTVEHDATDHDHPLTAVVVPLGRAVHPCLGNAAPIVSASWRGAGREGPRRPPRPI